MTTDPQARLHVPRETLRATHLADLPPLVVLPAVYALFDAGIAMTMGRRTRALRDLVAARRIINAALDTLRQNP